MTGKETIDFQAVFDLTPAPLMIMTADLEIVDMNQAFLKAAGRDRPALVGLNIFEAFPHLGESGRMLRNSLTRVCATGQADFIPDLQYPVATGGRGGERHWSCAHLPIPDKAGKIAYILQHSELIQIDHARVHPERADEYETEIIEGDVLLRPSDTRAVTTPLLAESTLLHNLFMQAPSFMCVLRGPELRFELANTAFAALTGFRDLAGRPFHEAIPEAEGQPFWDLLQRVFHSGIPFAGKQMRVEFARLPDGALEECYINFVYQPIFGANGEVAGIFIDGNDVTGHVLAEKSQALLVRELHHRVRNTLATVQGVMNSTARTAETIEDYQWAFSGRISSLARTHALLTEEIQQFVSFPHLLRQEIGIYCEGDSSRIALEGPDVELPSQLAVPLGMTIHELTTNAFRHGALSTGEGHVKVTWSIHAGTDKRVLICHWCESGGPAVIPPVRHGFGSMILTRVLAQQIGAKVDVDYAPGGFKLTAEIPLDIERL
ncbi:MAG: HWE histidine kinase domain-containing protein [Beijerinckiaceae bacterium]|nr:HWE histidine kinase domain-containing protein [Beijerinckiaceae bacterium]